MRHIPDIHIMTMNGARNIILWPKTKIASEWVLNNFGDNYEVFAQGIVIEPHLHRVLLEGLQSSDLSYLIQRS